MDLHHYFLRINLRNIKPFHFIHDPFPYHNDIIYIFNNDDIFHSTAVVFSCKPKEKKTKQNITHLKHLDIQIAYIINWLVIEYQFSVFFDDNRKKKVNERLRKKRMA